MVSWPADKIERRPEAGLVPYARNARQHSDAQVAQIAASIREWGWTNPVLLDESQGIIAGHGRVLAAHMLGIADIPVMVARGWSEAQRRAYVLADNKLAINADWDEELLRVELADLQAMGFGVELTGFTGDELEALLRGDDGSDDTGRPGALAEAFGVPPFSVLNAREGWWQDRKRAWIALGIESEVGRGQDHLKMAGKLEEYEGMKAERVKRGRKPNIVPGG